VNTPAPAKDRFTSLDTLALTKELRAISGAHVDKVFDAGPEEFTILLRAPGVGRRELWLAPGRCAALVPEGAPRSPGLSPLAKRLRELLTGVRVAEVPDPEGERSLRLDLRTPSSSESMTLVVELFAPGNLIVVRDGTIVAVSRTRRFAQREVRVGVPFVAPRQRASPWRMGVAETVAALEASHTDRASTIAARLSFGGPLAEEILARCGRPGSVPASDEAEQVARDIQSATARLLADIEDPPKGYLYRTPEGWVDVEPFPSTRFRSTPATSEERTDHFSNAALRFFQETSQPAPSLSPPEDTRRGELERRIRQQEEAVARLSSEAGGLRETADFLLARYPEIEQALEKTGPGGTGSESREVEVVGRKIEIPFGKTIRSFAQELYDNAKRVREKMEATRAAMEQSVRELSENRPPSPVLPRKPPVGARKRHWFERFRWFLSSDGLLVLGGRDAPTNDLLVRKYLRERDLYLHADIHGAASVVIRHPDGLEPIGEATKREAAQWALAFSKAWRAGHASGDAFWVTPEQVSKTAASGEFVPRGAWVIHGSRNVLHDLPLELGLGTLEYEGEHLWCVAPPEPFRRRGKLYYLLVPGAERERASREVLLSRELGVDRTRLQSLLPAGGFDARRA
jgi:predicted ribosome quality control (RQC) complex YloA/Tae2 family protein